MVRETRGNVQVVSCVTHATLCIMYNPQYKIHLCPLELRVFHNIVKAVESGKRETVKV